jgi:uncharacterized ion transporter superfamily protein YfcC
MAKNKKRKGFITAFSIILILIFLLGGITYLLPEAKFLGESIVDGSGVVRATIPDIIMAPILGFENAIDVSIFVLVLGGFLATVARTQALETGIQVLVKKLKGNELKLIPILMFIFSIGGTTYGMLEETVGFYALLAAAMVMAGMDTIVSSAIVLLGAGSGVLGSTINPFAVGAAVSALPEGIEVNQGIIIMIGVILWLTTLTIGKDFTLISHILGSSLAPFGNQTETYPTWNMYSLIAVLIMFAVVLIIVYRMNFSKISDAVFLFHDND